MPAPVAGLEEGVGGRHPVLLTPSPPPPARKSKSLSALDSVAVSARMGGGGGASFSDSKNKYSFHYYSLHALHLYATYIIKSSRKGVVPAPYTQKGGTLAGPLRRLPTVSLRIATQQSAIIISIDYSESYTGRFKGTVRPELVALRVQYYIG
jgi:hypothetical protein